MTLGDISQGIKLPDGCTIRVELISMDLGAMPNGVDMSKNDSKIIAVTKNLQDKNPDTITILVSKDVYMSSKASSVGIKVEDFQNDKLQTDEIYKGYREIELGSASIDGVYGGGLVLSSEML